MAELPPTPRRHLEQSLTRFAKFGIHANRDSPEPEEGFKPIRRKQNAESQYDETRWPKIDYTDKKRISKTRAKKKFLLTDNDLKDLCWEEGAVYKYENSHKYLCTELRYRAWQKHGGPTGLQFAQNERTQRRKQGRVAAAAVKQATPRRSAATKAKVPLVSKGRRPVAQERQMQSIPEDDMSSSDSDSGSDADNAEFQLPSPPTSPVPITPRKTAPTDVSRIAGRSTPTTTTIRPLRWESSSSKVADTIDLTLTDDDEDEVANTYPTPSRRRTDGRSKRSITSSSSTPKQMEFLGFIDISD